MNKTSVGVRLYRSGQLQATDY